MRAHAVAPAIATGNSTNDRIIEHPPLLRSAFSLFGRISPSLAAEAASRLFLLVPRVPAPRGEAAAFLKSGERFTVRGGGERLAAWRWGRGPAIVLAHGWGGRGTQLRAFVPALVSAGFAPVVFDAPAHGDSGGWSSSLPAFADSIAAVVRATGARGVVAHSMGGAATLVAIAHGLSLSRAVILGAPSDPPAIWAGFSRGLGLDDAVSAAARGRLERRVGVSFDELAIESLGPRVAAPVLVVHDVDDAEVPWSAGEANARLVAAGRLLTTRGLGHRRILRDLGVIGEVVGFLAEGIPPALCGACGRALGTEGTETLCGTCAVERELFARDDGVAA